LRPNATIKDGIFNCFVNFDCLVNKVILAERQSTVAIVGSLDQLTRRVGAKPTGLFPYDKLLDGRPLRAVKRFRARNGVTAMARTPVLAGATLVGALSARGLNRSRGTGGQWAERVHE
jgi:hypothetical protein